MVGKSKGSTKMGQPGVLLRSLTGHWVGTAPEGSGVRNWVSIQEGKLGQPNLPCAERENCGGSRGWRNGEGKTRL